MSCNYQHNMTRVRELREERECGLVEAKRIAKGEDLLQELDRLQPLDLEDWHRLVAIVKETVKDLYGA